MYFKNLEFRLARGPLLLLLILLMSTRAAPQQLTETNPQSQPSAVQGQPEVQISTQAVQPSTQTPTQNEPTVSQALRQDQQAAVKPAQPAVRVTTVSPFKLATVMPIKDVNKDILDYDDSFLASLDFGPPKTTNPTNQTAFVDQLLNRYHDNDQLYAYLLELTQNYPKITRLYDIGTSVEGRRLWVFEISENPGKHELLKPEFRYIANMHGNEVVGRELLLNLARLILENYYTNDETVADPEAPSGYKFIRKLVRATRIHLMPSMNPDGFVRSEVGCKYEVPSRKGRLNANNVDLNRNFPNKARGTQLDSGTQPETVAVMEWSKQIPFVLSANMHGGSLVAVIPYDASLNPATENSADERKCPDDETFVALSKAYSRSHPTMWNGEMCYDECTKYHPEVFPNDGITTGSGWYQMYGSMVDWAYDYTNDFQITLELGCNQYPPAESLRQYWDMNKVAMLSYMRQVHKGIKGMVTDAATGKPLARANVHVRSIDHNITSTQYGDYFRLLAPGTHRILYEYPGYQSEEISISLRDTMAQIHNIRLKPLDLSQSHQVPVLPEIQSQNAGQPVVTIDDSDSRVSSEGAHPIAVATLVMSVITVALLILLAGAYVIQKRRFTRSQSVSVELQPTGRSTSSTGISLPPLKGTPTSGSHMQA